MVARGQLVHGDHCGARLLAPKLQHGEQVQGHGAHVSQGADLNINLINYYSKVKKSVNDGDK